MKRAVFALFLLFQASALAASDRPSVSIELTGRESPETVERLISTAQKGDRAVSVRINEAAAAAGTPDEQRAPNLFAMVMNGIDLGLSGMAQMPRIPGTWMRHYEANQADLSFGHWLRAALLAAAAMLVGLAARMAARWLLPDTTPQKPAPMELGARLVASLRRLVPDLIGIFVFLKTAQGLDVVALQPVAPVLSRLYDDFIHQCMVVLNYVAGIRFMLKPYANGDRLLRLPNAGRSKWLLILYGVVGPAVLLGDQALAWAGASAGERAGFFMLAGSAVAAYKIWFFWHIRHDIAGLILSGTPEGRAPSGLRQTMAQIAGPLLCLMAALIWVLGRIAAGAPSGVGWGQAAAATQFYVVIAPLVAAGAGQLVRGWMSRSTGDIQPTPLRIALRDTAALAVGAAFTLVAIADLGRLWSHFLNTVIGQTGVNILQGIVAAAVTAIAGGLIWIFLKRLLEEYLPKRRAPSGPSEDDQEDNQPTIQSRLSSVMPVLRGVALALVVAITALVVLNRLGIDTGPLLAGFGIAGLALSFGSQALVRDVVSGIFFLADDAFRVGEYIDTGKLKGTVERITLRSVQLRHQSGLVHTIPYGQLQAVTNASRDWATVKFNIRLDRDADIEKARKTIKKVGQDLLAHEELGEDFIMPVKMQGIVDIQDNALVVRIKFTAKPFRTSQIQREALKRIYLKLIEAGVQLATADVRVRSGPPELAAAAFAAATPTTIQPAGPL